MCEAILEISDLVGLFSVHWLRACIFLSLVVDQKGERKSGKDQEGNEFHPSGLFNKQY